jgi:translation initiation factor IF-3
MNYGKYLYQKNKRAHEAKKHQKQIQVKEIKFRVKIDEHDYNFKKNHVERFLMEGNKVKTTIMFRGRERSHGQLGVRILDRLATELKDIALIENRSEWKATRCIRSFRRRSPIVEKLKSSRDGGRALPSRGGNERRRHRGTGVTVEKEIEDPPGRRSASEGRHGKLKRSHASPNTSRPRRHDIES